MSDSEEESGSSAIDIEKMSAAIANTLASSRQHTIPIFSGGKNEDPIKFMRVFERVAKALKWDDRTKCDKFPAYLSGAGEDFHYLFVDCALEKNDQHINDDSYVKPENWNELKALFMNHFLNGNYKLHLTKELRNRKKLDTESMAVYITAIQAICHDLDQDMSTEQVISYALEGLEPNFAAQIQYFNPKGIKQLIEISRNIELGMERLQNTESSSSSSKSKVKKTLNIQTKSKLKDSTEESSDSNPLLEAVNKLNESINSLSLNKNENKINNQKSNNKRNFNPNFQKSNGVKRNYYSNNTQNYNSNNTRNLNNNGFYRNINQNRSQNDNFRFKSKIQCWSCGNTGHKSNECRTKSRENYANNRNVETNNGNADNNVSNIVKNPFFTF
jgi:hypothetical protein